MSSLPPPSPDALDVSHRLQQHLQQLIQQQGGWISFADYMEQALYAPGLGYYSNGSRKFGADGDFVTAPELGSLFAACLAQQLAAWLPELPDVLEIGPGSGRLAHDLLLMLDAGGPLPRRYFLLERSADLRQRQQELLDQLPPALRQRVHWLDQLPQQFEGVILANEVLDALPAHRVCWRDDGLYEQGVGWSEQGLSWQEQPLSHAGLAAYVRQLPQPPHTPWRSEACLAAGAWVASLLDSCQRAALLFIDYGYGRREYYHEQRDNGTLTGFYRHHQVQDPFFLPGLMDLTCHVDFTAIADAALDHDGLLLGYTTQAAFLLDCGLTRHLQGVDTQSRAWMALSQQVQTLTHPAEMGELFKVMAIGKGFADPGPGFESPGREFQL